MAEALPGYVLNTMEQIHEMTGGFDFCPHVPLTDVKHALLLADHLASLGVPVRRRWSYDFCVYGPGEPLPLTDGREIRYAGNTLIFVFQWRKEWSEAERVGHRYAGPDVLSARDRILQALRAGGFELRHHPEFDKYYVHPSGVSIAVHRLGVRAYYRGVRICGFMHTHYAPPPFASFRRGVAKTGDELVNLVVKLIS